MNLTGTFFFFRKSPIDPKPIPKNILSRCGSAASPPADFKSNPITSLMNLGAPVIWRYRPQRLPKCRTCRAQKGRDVNIEKYGGTA